MKVAMAVSLLQTTNFQPQSFSNDSAALMDNGMDIDMDLDLGPVDNPEASDVSARSQPPNRPKAHLRTESAGASDWWNFARSTH